MKPSLTLSLLLALACSPPVTAKVVYVKAGSNGDGSSWASALPAVQNGITAAASGDEVWVAQGTYTGSVALKNGVGLYGGFVGTETVRDTRNPATNVTTLDGGTMNYIRTVTADASVRQMATVDGFTITHGDGGMAFGNALVTVSNNVITANRTGGDGGGLYATGATLVVDHNTFTGNGALVGGAVYCTGGSCVIINNDIENNLGLNKGGGVHCIGSGIIANNVIKNNTTGEYYTFGNGHQTNTVFLGGDAGGIGVEGAIAVTRNSLGGNVSGTNFGVISVSGGSPVISENTFRDNTGYALACFDGSPLFQNNLVANSYKFAHTFQWGGVGGLYCSAGTTAFNNNTLANGAEFGIYVVGGSCSVTNNIITGFNGGVCVGQQGPKVLRLHNNDVNNNINDNYETNNYVGTPDATGTDGNISEDARFVNSAAADYRLKLSSPAINAGDNSETQPGETDLDGRPRVQDGYVDMGAYELPITVNPVTFADATRALRLAAGIGTATNDDKTRLNVETSGASAGVVDMADAARLASGPLGWIRDTSVKPAR